MSEPNDIGLYSNKHNTRSYSAIRKKKEKKGKPNHWTPFFTELILHLQALNNTLSALKVENHGLSIVTSFYSYLFKIKWEDMGTIVFKYCST